MGQNRCARSVTNHVWLILMKSVINGKVLFPQMITVCQKKFHVKKINFGKITKTAKNHFFLLKGGNFFMHTLIIWGNSIFSFSIIFDSIKKAKKTLFHFFLAKNFPSFNFESQQVLKIKIFMKSLQNRNCNIQPN